MSDIIDATEALQTTEPTAIESLTRGEVDMQVATAKRWPRSMAAFKKRALSMVTSDPKVAASCFYELRRGGSEISGPSVRMAEIVAQCYGNLRTGARIIAEDSKTVTAQGVCWDMESNVMVTREVQQRITKSNGQRYSDDMIIVASNAAASKAFRNAVFSVVPRSLVESLRQDAKRVAIGEGETFDAARQKWIGWFRRGKLNDDQIAALAGRKRIDDIDGDDLAKLIGLANAVTDGEMSGDELRRMAKDATEAAAMPPTIDLGGSPKPKAAPAPAAPAEPPHDPQTGEVAMSLAERLLRCNEALVQAGAKPADWHKHLKAAIGKTKATDADIDTLEDYVANWCAEQATKQ